MTKRRQACLILSLALICALCSGCGPEDTSGSDDGGDAKPETSLEAQGSKDAEAGGGKEKEKDEEEGKDKDGEDKDGEGDNGEEEAPVKMVMTLSEATDFIRRLPPGTLGLKGEDMGGYQVYAADEMVPVDGLSCAKLSVYRRSETSETNAIEGIYLLVRDGSRLFRLDPEESAVTELPLPGGAQS